MTKNLQPPSTESTVFGGHNRRIDALEKRGRRGVAGEAWVYVGSGGDIPGSGDPPESVPDFVNGWENAGGASLRFRFVRDDTIQIEGHITGGNLGTTIFTVPANYRPLRDTFIVLVDILKRPAVIEAKSTGAVIWRGNAGGSSTGAGGGPWGWYRRSPVTPLQVLPPHERTAILFDSESDGSNLEMFEPDDDGFFSRIAPGKGQSGYYLVTASLGVFAAPWYFRLNGKDLPGQSLPPGEHVPFFFIPGLGGITKTVVLPLLFDLDTAFNREFVEVVAYNPTGAPAQVTPNTTNQSSLYQAPFIQLFQLRSLPDKAAEE